MRSNFLFILSFIMTIVAQASFPVVDGFAYYNDTIVPDTSQNISRETTEQYHARIQKQGFDISSCMCQSCVKNGPIKGSKFTAPRLPMVLFFVFILIIFVLIIMTITTNDRSPEGSRSNFNFQDWWESP